MIVHTTGYPRSGNTWIGKLLSDVVDGQWLPAPIAEGIVVGGNGNSGIVVTKNHKRRDEITDSNPVVFVYRDPRDVAVSLWHYRTRMMTLKETIERMVNVYDPNMDLYGPYEGFVRSWWGIANAQIAYEELQEKPVEAIERVLGKIGLTSGHIRESVERQEFSVVKNSNLERFSHHMRKGIVGDWHNYFDHECEELIYEKLGILMSEQGYRY
jgi:hypothetical protein